MEGVPEKCPTCSTAIPEGAVRCPGCGRVFGEDNRCPHCHAIAAVRAVGGGYACLACGKPRERLPSTTVQGEPDARSSVVPLAPVGTPRTGALGGVGAAAAVAGLLLAGASLGVLGTTGLGLVVALAGALVALGGLGLARAGRSRQARLEAQRRKAIEARILALAAKRQGDLTVKDVAGALRIPEALADDVLTRMSDGTTITAEVDESVGVLHFRFVDLVPALPKTRVEVPAEVPADAAPQGTERDATEEEAPEAEPERRRTS